MAADDRHIGIYHQRIGKTELLNGVLDLLVLLVPPLQLFPGIVISGPPAYEFCVFPHERGHRSSVDFTTEK